MKLFSPRPRQILSDQMRKVSTSASLDPRTQAKVISGLAHQAIIIYFVGQDRCDRRQNSVLTFVGGLVQSTTRLPPYIVDGKM
jgi:hypothetical protein